MNTTRVHILVLVLVALLLYGRTASYDFTYDDVLQVVHNPAVNDLTTPDLKLSELFLLPTPPGNLYRPLSTLTYRATTVVAGLNPLLFHLTNIVLYILCCVLVYLFYRAILKDQPSVVFCAALLFATHPTHVEVVANVIGRAEMLVLLFGVAALLVLQHAVSRTKILIPLLALSALLYLLACLAKESALTLVALYPLFLWLCPQNRQTSRARLLAVTMPFCLSAFITLGLRYAALGDSFRIISDGVAIYPENPLFHLPLSERFIPALKILGEYIAQTILPIRLSADYSSMPDSFLAGVYSPSGLLSAALPLLILTAMFLQRGRRHIFGGLWFFISFALSCNMLTPIGTIRADRLLFLPGAGLILFCIGSMAAVLKNPRYARIRSLLPVIFCVLFLFRSWVRTPVWEDNSTLFAETVLDAPRSPKAHYNLAVEYFQEGRLSEARREALIALRLHPKYLFAARLLADIAHRRGDIRELEKYYLKILEIQPNDTQVSEYLETLRLLKRREVDSANSDTTQ